MEAVNVILKACIFPEMRLLMEMLVVAERERKFVIHFGV